MSPIAKVEDQKQLRGARLRTVVHVSGRAKVTKNYPLGLVGEQYYQAAIRRCRVGEQVFIYRELGNPHDPKALCVKVSDGGTIGYVPRDNWVQGLVHDAEGGIYTTILEIRDGNRGFREIVLAAEPRDNPDDLVPSVNYQQPTGLSRFGALLRHFSGVESGNQLLKPAPRGRSGLSALPYPRPATSRSRRSQPARPQPAAR